MQCALNTPCTAGALRLSPTTGSATYACSAGVWGSATNTSCSDCSPINGGWGSWTPDTSSTTCGTSFNQTRTCTNPTPSCGGTTCTGSASQSATGTKCPSGQSCVSGQCQSSSTCPSKSVSWAAGSHENNRYCKGTVPKTSFGSTVTISNTNTFRYRSAKFTCNNDGSWGSASSKECNTSCVKKTPSWGCCYASNVPYAISGATQEFTSVSNCTGTAVGTCQGARWIMSETTCIGSGDKPCYAESKTWTGTNNASCTADIGTGKANDVQEITAETGNTKGTATYTRTNGQWVKGASSCVAISACPGGYKKCAGQSVYWDNSRCTGSIGASCPPSGYTFLSVTDNEGQYRGHASITCHTSGYYYIPSWGEFCDLYCESEPVDWTVGQKTCYGTANSGYRGRQQTVTDGTTPNTGSAAFFCTGNETGTSWSMESSPAPTCY